MRVEDKQAAERCYKLIPSNGGSFSIPRLFKELMMGWSGFTLTGEEADEGFNEPERSLRLVNPKSYVSPFKTT
jgi:hypothetical protein